MGKKGGLLFVSDYLEETLIQYLFNKVLRQIAQCARARVFFLQGLRVRVLKWNEASVEFTGKDHMVILTYLKLHFLQF